MKSLKESILSATKAGKYALAEDWCNKYLDSPFTINSKNEVCISNHYLTLNFEDYNELPEYIQFADDDRLEISLLDRENHEKVTSLKGLPKICNKLNLNLGKEIPAFEMTVLTKVEFRQEPKITGDIRLNTPTIKLLNSGKIDIKKIHIENLYTIDLRYSFFYSKLFKNSIKPFVKNAIVNTPAYGGFDPSRIEYKHPLENDPESVIKKVFGDFCDVKTLEIIYYSDRRSLVKHDGQWYLTN